MENIFLQAMAASGIHDVVTGEHGIDCMTALVDEYRLQRDEIQRSAPLDSGLALETGLETGVD